MSSTNAGDDPITRDDDASIKATYAGAKRRIAALEQQLKDLQEAGTKKTQ